ncbi:histone family protein DNA-binding protein [Acidithiobacillus ferrivorans SS3]|uniref:Integration host factor subunit alpha n=1 Tax=Acidithiobacillus ferrivorans SS3 TaxID=743299 RepID=G0JLN0_9PROT|nr:integration host factor subunit alpha [Acidithiobacillus ferrivorans]AEM48079.1 histone family protein DNA-binding protein [Acidithiobacillus ferrivorans SS3]
MAVTKKEIVDHLVDTVGFTGKESQQIVESLFNTIRETLASGDGVKLAGFGRFNILDKRARPGRNPKDGTPFEITARRVVTYTSSRLLRGRWNGPE